MLRWGLSQRDPVACAFWQHRLSVQRASIFHRRLLSSTTALHDDSSNSTGRRPATHGPPSVSSSPDWGRGAGWGGGGGSWGQNSVDTDPASRATLPNSGGAGGHSELTGVLLPHEIEARQRIAAQRNAELQAAQERKTPVLGAGMGPRFVWDARKQQEIQEHVNKLDSPTRTHPLARRREDIARMMRPLAFPQPLGQPPHTQQKMEPPSRRETSPRRKGPMAFEPQRSEDAATGGPHSLKRQSTMGDLPSRRGAFRTQGSQAGFPLSINPSNMTTKDIHPTHAIRSDQPPSKSWIGDNETLQKTPSTPDTSGNLVGSTWGSVAGIQKLAAAVNRREPEAKIVSMDNSWSSLSRKQQPEKLKGTDFWAMFDQTVERAKSDYPWSSPTKGTGLDLGQLKGRDMDPNSPRRAASDSWNPSRNQGRREQQETASMASQGVATSNLREKVDMTSFAEVNPTYKEISEGQIISPHHTASAEKYEYRYNSKRRDFDRDDRFDFKQEKEHKGGRKRTTRSSRHDDDDEIDDPYGEYPERKQKRTQRKAQQESLRVGPQLIMLPEFISISSLASALKVEKHLFLEQLGELGFEGVSFDSIMTGETAALVVQEYGFEPSVETGESEDLKPLPPPEDPSSLPSRPPVVTIMGHVDHGKTTLLDYLRKSSVVAQEHGGITQHIGAFSVKLSGGKQITFLDTPGHSAFLTMRQRGANVTDIVVLVVAADDSVKPQTLEALKHARNAKVPMIVAINKVDKDTAQIDQVKADLARNGVEIEDYGGDVQVVCVSGKTGQGMADLEENILVLSEILDMRAEYDGPAEGWILESSLKPIGKAATVLVKRGTLRPGDYIAAGITWAKIRHLRNEAGVEIEEAPPGTPVEILGWRDLPVAGDQVIQGADEARVRRAAEYREGLREQEQDAAAHEQITEQRRLLQEQRQAEEEDGAKQGGWGWGVQEQVADSGDGPKIVNLVVKGDVHGSVEAVCASIQELGTHEVRPRILRSSPGQITESDVEHAATSGSTIINFNLPIPGHVKRQAELADVKILDHTVIYHLSDAVKDHLSGHLGFDISYQVLGEAEVLQIFPINVRGRLYKNIAGCKIRNGKIQRNSTYRVFRGGEKIFEGKLESLKHGKKDVDEARKGGECGVGFEVFQDLQVGDQIQAVEEVRTQRSL